MSVLGKEDREGRDMELDVRESTFIAAACTVQDASLRALGGGYIPIDMGGGLHIE